MKKAQQQAILGLIDSLHQIHEEIRKALEQNNFILAQNMISESQEAAISLGETIEKIEGEGHITVSHIEEYCELLFCIYVDIDKKNYNLNKVYKKLRRQLIEIENSAKYDISVRKEVVFFPYKASMWDSLESIYYAAKADPDCDAYCVPIPYYTLNPDHSFGEMHYEGDEYPEDIEITDWQEYNLEERRPDVIYIHNPYDNGNLVTSVHPRFYSFNLKKYTDCLVYIPYYSTSGGMSEAQSICPAYIFADYIVIQSPTFRRYFDASIPDRKFLPFGSPKFDKIIKKCQNPPETSAEWKEKIAGKKVYFYNTSLSGMLVDTRAFLMKMSYVFECFEGREDACLLWRPHPLLKATFDSMRPHYRHVYDALEQMFMDKNLGILDTTPDITDSIALSDAYIGDAGSSVTSLFGVAGKPVFILNNRIHSEPKEDGWRKEITLGFDSTEQGRYFIKEKKLYVSEPYQYDYKYCCDLSDDECIDNYYSIIKEINGKKYACCSTKSQDILEIEEDGTHTKVKLRKEDIEYPAFGSAWKYKDYLLLVPINYSSVVRYNTVTEDIDYFRKYVDRGNVNTNDQHILGATWLYQGILYIASLIDNIMYELNIEDGNIQFVDMGIKSQRGCNCMVEYKGDMWLLPYEGKGVVRWNPATGEIKEYVDLPPNFICQDPVNNSETNKYPFETLAFDGDYMYLTPLWGNMYLKLNLVTGEFVEWQPPFEDRITKDEFDINMRSRFIWDEAPKEDGHVWRMYSKSKQQLFQIKLESNEYDEIKINFDIEELRKHEAGFCECSEKLRYACMENSINSLKVFLDGKVWGGQFDREKQIQAYKAVVANLGGNCGKEIYDFINREVSETNNKR